MAEHIACVFGVATLFVLCNPDKVRAPNDTSPVGHACHKWPLALACGYGKNAPTNRYLIDRQQQGSSSATAGPSSSSQSAADDT